MPAVRRLPEYREDCGRQISTLETCVLPEGTRQQAIEVTFGKSAEGGIRCRGCAPVGAGANDGRSSYVPGDSTINDIIRLDGTDMLLIILLRKAGRAVEFDENDIVWARTLMVDWTKGWRPASKFASVRFKRRGWVDLKGAHPDVYELRMWKPGRQGRAGSTPP